MDYECDVGYIRADDGACVEAEDADEKSLVKQD